MSKMVKILAIGIACMLILGGLAFSLFWFVFKDIIYTGSPDKWETVTGSSYTMTMPKGMRDRELDYDDDRFKLVDCKSNHYVVIAIGQAVMTKEERKIANRLDMFTLMKELTPTRTVDGVKVEPQKHGDIIYMTFTQALDGKQYRLVEAMYISETSLYEVDVLCLEDSYEEYEANIFEWLESFEPAY